MSKHTPGPWRVGTPGPNGLYTVGTRQGLMTAMVAHSANHLAECEQTIADARLIAAAPELLDALQNILMHIGKGRENDVDWVCEPIHSDEIKAARAAIAKATGTADD